MDSLSRRRALQEILSVPPVLLGLAQIPEVEPGYEAVSKLSAGKSLDIKSYQMSLAGHWAIYHHTSPGYHGQSLLESVKNACIYLYHELPHYTGKQKQEIIVLIIEYHRIASDLLRDQKQYDMAIDHLNKAYTLANEVRNTELLALILSTRAMVKRERGGIQGNLENLVGARADYSEIQTLDLRKLPANLQASLLLAEGLILAKFALSQVEKTNVLHMMDHAERLTREGVKENDPHFLRLNWDRYHLSRASALTAIGYNQNAINSLLDTDCPVGTRRWAYNNILLARAYTQKAQYDMAMGMLEGALPVVRNIQSDANLARIKQIYMQMGQTIYRDTPEFARFGLMLRS